MPVSTLMTLRRLTRNQLGVPLSDDFFTDPIVDDHINMAIQQIDAEYRWPWNEVVDNVTITSAAPDIPVPEDWMATRGIYTTDGFELYYIAPGDLMAYESVTGEQPRVWCPMSSVIAIRPIPNGNTVLKHYWSCQSPWLQQDNDAPRIPAQFAGAVVAKAAALLASREGSGADVSRHQASAEDWVARLRREVRRSTGPTRVRVRPGGWV